MAPQGVTHLAVAREVVVILVEEEQGVLVLDAPRVADPLAVGGAIGGTATAAVAAVKDPSERPT